MTREQLKRARTDEERRYYALNARAWPIVAPFYDVIVLPLKRLRRDVARLAGVGPGSRVLDVATGTGAQALAFAETGAEVVGIDLSESMLGIARRKARGRDVTFRLGDARELPFEDALFDVCCVSYGLHEMPVSVRQEVLLEMARVTKPTGKVVIVDYALPENPIASQLVYHLVKLYERDNYAEFVRSDLHAMLERAGLAARTEARVAPGAAMRWWSPAMVVLAAKVEASGRSDESE
jgi:demethylmenaquinone methyltransferase/2-methoxy-6-polyprenyl-1,4-benzoquinol methylase